MYFTFIHIMNKFLLNFEGLYFTPWNVYTFIGFESNISTVYVHAFVKQLFRSEIGTGDNDVLQEWNFFLLCDVI